MPAGAGGGLGGDRECGGKSITREWNAAEFIEGMQVHGLHAIYHLVSVTQWITVRERCMSVVHQVMQEGKLGA